MQFSKPFYALAAATNCYAASAPVVSNNPTGVSYVAKFPATGPDQDVTGYVAFNSDNGTAKVNVVLQGLPADEGAITYHIHAKPIPEGGSCADTAAHLNPFAANSTAVCDKSNPSTCEVGDLSGKHGSIMNTTSFKTSYYDPYLSLNSSSSQFIGNLSINIHLKEKNNTRIACANIVVDSSSSVGSNSSNSSNGSNTSSTSVSTGAAGHVTPIVGAFAAGLAAFLI